MNQRAKKLIAGVSLAMTLLVTPTIANAADNHVYSQTITRGANNGQNGYWVNIVDRTYTWVPALSGTLPGFPFDASDLAALSARGITAAQLQAFAPNPNIPGESTYPAGFWSRDPATMRSLFDNGQFDNRDTFVNTAEGNGSVTRPFNFDDVMTSVGWTTGGWWQDNTETNLAQSVMGAWEVINVGGNQKIAPTFETGLDGNVERSLLWGGSGSRVDDLYVSGSGTQLSKTVSYFMSEMQRYLDLSRFLAQNGASDAAAAAKDRATTLGMMLASYVSDPLVLDLNGNGKIDVTGKSSAKFRKKGNETMVEANSVMFDLTNSGKAVRTEWIANGDGFLIDNRNDRARKQIEAGKNLTIVNLFGDSEGYPGGFMKLAGQFDSDAKVATAKGSVVAKDLGIIKGKDLDNLLVWINNGDGKAKLSELHTLSSLGITEIRLPAHFTKNEQGEYLEQATFIRDGKPGLIQEVWFAHR